MVNNREYSGNENPDLDFKIGVITNQLRCSEPRVHFLGQGQGDSNTAGILGCLVHPPAISRNSQCVALDDPDLTKLT